MHEASLVTALLARVEAEAAARGAARVHRVEVVLGELAGVEPAQMLAAWEVFRARTRCEGAALVLTVEAARWQCPRCGAEVPRGGFLTCAPCAVPARLRAGGEATLQRIEMEIDDDEAPAETAAAEVCHV